MKFFCFILTSLCVMNFFVCVAGLAAHFLWNIEACILVQHQIKCTYTVFVVPEKKFHSYKSAFVGFIPINVNL